MELITKYPVLVDPTTEQKNQFRFTPNTDGLPGALQTVNVGDFTIKGTTPVFEGDRQVSENDFLYLKPIKDNGETLTPMDEYLYSERNFSEGALGFGEFENWGDVFSNASGKDRRAQRRMLKIDKETYRKALKDEKGATVAEQEAKLEEGKFWNILKGGWESFKTSPSGQIIIDSAATNISNRLGGGSFSQPGGADVTPAPKTDDEPKPLSATTKYVLIGLGVLVVGAIIYSAVKKK